MIVPQELKLFENFYIQRTNSTNSTWINQLREKAFQLLIEQTIPHSGMESWRRISLKNINFENIFKDLNQFISLKIHNQNENIYFSEFETIQQSYLKRIEELFLSSLEKNKHNFFSLLANMSFEKAYYLKIPDNTQLSEPLILEISYKEYVSQASPILFIEIGKNTKVQIIERTTSPLSEEIHLFNSNTEVIIGENSFLEYISMEDFNSQALHFRNTNFTLSNDSNCNVGHFNLGGYKGKTFINAFLNGTGSNINTYGVCAPIKREFQDIEYSIYHNASHTQSSLKFNTVCQGKSHHIFTGNLNVPISSKQVEANQINHNLLLDKNSRTESNPRLEIFSDSVKCSHGATMSEIDESQLFYLNTRGIQEQDARKLIVEGFLLEIIDSVPNSDLKSELLNRLIQKISY
jgi:uncharacterized protein